MYTLIKVMRYSTMVTPKIKVPSKGWANATQLDQRGSLVRWAVTQAAAQWVNGWQSVYAMALGSTI